MRRTWNARLGLVLALCGCGKAFDAGSATDGGGSGASGAFATAGASAGPGGTAGASARAGAGGTPIAAGGTTHAGGTPSMSGAPSTGGAASMSGAPSTSGGAPSTGGTSGVGGLVGLGGNGSIAGAGPVSQIPTDGLALWLTADRGVVLKDGQAQQWLDQSGQHMDAIGTATNIQPKFEASGLNGLPTLDFDGVDDFMTLPEGFSDFSKGASIFIVANAADGACASMFEASNGTEVQDISLGMYQNTWQYEVENEDINGGVIDTATPQPGAIASVQRTTTGVVELRFTGTLLHQQQFMAPEVVLRTENFIGHTMYASCGYFQGQISEVLVYDRGVTDKEMLAIESYLQDHWVLKLP